MRTVVRKAGENFFQIAPTIGHLKFGLHLIFRPAYREDRLWADTVGTAAGESPARCCPRPCKASRKNSATVAPMTCISENGKNTAEIRPVVAPLTAIRKNLSREPCCPAINTPIDFAPMQKIQCLR